MTPPAAAAAAAIPATRPAPARRGAPGAPARPTRPAPARPRRIAAPARRLTPRAEVVGTPVRLLDRLIRSRSWIALVAFSLIGIVAMQLWLLKLNGGIGRAIEHEGYLQRTNAALSAEDSAMSAGDLIEQQAAAAGMTIMAPGKLIFLHTRGAMDERLAAARLAQPVQAPTGTGASSNAATQSSTTGIESSTSSAQQSSAGTEPSTTGTELSPADAEAPSTGNQPVNTGAQAPSPSTTQPEPQG
jgi:hypothetical protein